jgi:hypothetical protein
MAWIRSVPVRPKYMAIEPSHRTAAAGGAWSALGFVPFNYWLTHNHMTSVVIQNLLWLFIASVFLFAPFFYLVLGRNARAFKRTWVLDSEERTRYAVVAKRMFVWFVSAATTGTALSLLLSYA